MRHSGVPHPPACREAAAYLYRDEASWAAMGTSLANRSGPVTLGSVGLTGRALTSGAPGGAKENWFDPLEPDQTGSLVQVECDELQLGNWDDWRFPLLPLTDVSVSVGGMGSW